MHEQFTHEDVVGALYCSVNVALSQFGFISSENLVFVNDKDMKFSNRRIGDLMSDITILFITIAKGALIFINGLNLF